MTFPTVYVEVGFTTTSTGNYWHIGDSARGKIGTAAIGPDAGLWTDITSYVLSFTTGRGSNRVDSPAIRYDAGKLTVVLDDSDRRFDPENLSGPYVSGGVTQVTPMRPVRIRATHDGVSYDIWRGFADSWRHSYDGPRWAECVLTATDGTKVLAAYDRQEVVAVGAGEDSGARVARILDSADWPTADRIISTGDSTLQATTLEGNAWSELLKVHDAELGELYFDAAGRAVFRNRLAVLEESRSSTSQATFGDEGSELRYADITPEYDDEHLANVVTVTRTGGTAQTVQDAASISNYLTHTLSVSDVPLDSDAQAASLAGWLLYQMKEPETRFAELVVNPRRASQEDLLFAQVLGRQIGDRITVYRRPPGGGSAIAKDCFIRGVFHDVKPQVWRTRFVLQSATRYQFWTIGHSTLGRIGYNAIAG